MSTDTTQKYPDPKESLRDKAAQAALHRRGRGAREKTQQRSHQQASASSGLFVVVGAVDVVSRTRADTYPEADIICAKTPDEAEQIAEDKGLRDTFFVQELERDALSAIYDLTDDYNASCGASPAAERRELITDRSAAVPLPSGILLDIDPSVDVPHARELAERTIAACLVADPEIPRSGLTVWIEGGPENGSYEWDPSLVWVRTNQADELVLILSHELRHAGQRVRDPDCLVGEDEDERDADAFAVDRLAGLIEDGVIASAKEAAETQWTATMASEAYAIAQQRSHRILEALYFIVEMTDCGWEPLEVVLSDVGRLHYEQDVEADDLTGALSRLTDWELSQIRAIVVGEKPEIA